MSSIPTELRYTASHEWVRDEGDGSFTMGITDHAQTLLGDMVFVELPETEVTVSAGDEIAVAESVKAASDIYSPLSGDIAEINEQLEDAPQLVNSDCYNDGWLVRIRASDISELDDLLDADSYTALLEDVED